MNASTADRKKDLVDEIEERLRGFAAQLRPGVERALQELDRQAEAAEAAVRRAAPKVEQKWNEDVRPHVDRVVADVRPKVDDAARRVRPGVDRAVREAQPTLDRFLRFLAEQLERLRSSLERKADRAAARQNETTTARPPAPVATVAQEPPAPKRRSPRRGGEAGE